LLPDGKQVAVYDRAGKVGVWETSKGKNVFQVELAEAKAVVSGIAVSANGEYLAVTGSEFRQRPGTTMVFATATGKEVGRFENTRLIVFDSKRDNSSVAVVTATETGHAVTVRPVAEWLKPKAK
jgi:hypothetical protein